jgi:hypothetical protein
MKLSILSLVLVGICSNSYAMDICTEQISKNLAEAQGLVKALRADIKYDLSRVTSTSPEHVEFMLKRFNGYVSCAEQVQILVEPIMNNKDTPFSMKTEAELCWETAISIKESYYENS